MGEAVTLVYVDEVVCMSACPSCFVSCFCVKAIPVPSARHCTVEVSIKIISSKSTSFVEPAAIFCYVYITKNKN